MFVLINNKKISYDSDISYCFNDFEKIVLFSSPNHCENNKYKFVYCKDYRDYTNLFPNDSFLFIDNKSKTVKFFRDWPGNVQVFFYYSSYNKELIISDNISEIVKYKKTINASEYGLNLFINQRKHFHSKTIYKDVFMLHPGLYLDLTLVDFNLSINPWYYPFKEISINNINVAEAKYLEAIDNSIRRLVPKDKPVAIMFSGGSDSVFILWRMIELGYKKIDLFALCVKGQEIQFNYARENAKYFGYDVNPVYVDSKNLFSDWKELFKYCYHYLSDLRIDGLFAPSIKLLNKLKDKYNNNSSTIVWGSQYALASPVITTKALLLKIYPTFLLIKLGKLFKFLLPITDFICLKLIRSHMLHKKYMNSKSRSAFKKLYLTSFRKINHPDQIINLFLSTDYNHLKHWWMDWRNKVAKEYYPNGRNVFPFHDRIFQESTMSLSLSVRIGGFFKIFKMPYNYKNFFFKLFPDELEISKIKRGNYTALPEWLSLFGNKNFYNCLINDIKNSRNKNLVEFLCKSNHIKLPENYDEFITLDTKEIEKISGILFLLVRLDEDAILF